MTEIKEISKKTIAERLLQLRELAGDDEGKNRRYHALVTRYQKLLLRKYLEVHGELSN